VRWSTVAVVGAGRATPDEERAAEEVGRRLAARRVTVITGGLGGVMTAACRGASEAGGHTVGMLPGVDPAAANPWVELAVPTGLGEARNTLVVRSAGAVVAIGGEYGTLSEIAFALKIGVPVVGLGTWQLSRRGEPDPGIEVVTTAEEAVEVACARARW
jgi:uncharacterized protein (TIGR00725 family)